MRTLLAAITAGALAASGCAGHQGAAPTFSDVPGPNRPPPVNTKQNVIVTPDSQLSGKIVRVNLDGRFVVLNFPIGHLPAINQRLNVYRRGLKTGEITVTGPQLDDNVVGDIAVGDAQAGDDVRAQ